MLLDQLGSVFKAPGLAGTHRGTSTGQTFIRHCPTLPGHRGSWHLNLLMAILLLQDMSRTVSVVTLGRHLAPCSPPSHTMTDMEEFLCLSPSRSSALNARGCSHGHGAQALLHCSGLHSRTPVLPILHPQHYITYRPAAGPPSFLASLSTPIPPQREKRPSDIRRRKVLHVTK